MTNHQPTMHQMINDNRQGKTKASSGANVPSSALLGVTQRKLDMMIFLILLIVTVSGFMALHWFEDCSPLHFVGFMASIFGATCLFIALIVLPISRMGTHSQIAKFNAIDSTVQAARMRGESIENAAMQLKVAEANQWMASSKYWNRTVFDIWIHDDVSELRAIK